jgi:hypothetical protein
MLLIVLSLGLAALIAWPLASLLTPLAFQPSEGVPVHTEKQSGPRRVTAVAGQASAAYRFHTKHKSSEVAASRILRRRSPRMSRTLKKSNSR